MLGKALEALVQSSVMAEMTEAERAWPHSSLVIALPFPVERS